MHFHSSPSAAAVLLAVSFFSTLLTLSYGEVIRIDETGRSACTIAGNCSGNAVAVSWDSATKSCVCTCRNEWSGASCEQCPAGVDPAMDCSECLPGYDTYPECYLLCTIAANCSGHASLVSGDSHTGCDCTCRNQWIGVHCGQCPGMYDPSQDCGACAQGFSGYPMCTPTETPCTVAGNCSGNALYVTGNSLMGCNCVCENQWYGPTCNLCPNDVDPNANCGACVSGCSGYPNCAQTCTIAADCSGHAVQVNGTYATGCVCTCENQWTGSSCEECPSKFNTTLSCAACALGYDNYPLCTPSNGGKRRVPIQL